MKSLLNTRVIKKSKKDRYFKVNYKTQKFENSMCVSSSRFFNEIRFKELVIEDNKKLSVRDILIINIFEFSSRVDLKNFNKLEEI